MYIHTATLAMNSHGVTPLPLAKTHSVISYPKFFATILFASVLATLSPSQQGNQTPVPELAAATRRWKTCTGLDEVV